MSYLVTIEGGYGKGSGSATETHHVKEALIKLYQELEGRGHKMTTAFINDKPFNAQVPEERNKALQEADDHYGVIREHQSEPAPVAVPLSSEGEAPPTLTTPQIPGKAPEPSEDVTAGGPPTGATPAKKT